MNISQREGIQHNIHHSVAETKDQSTSFNSYKKHVSCFRGRFSKLKKCYSYFFFIMRKDYRS